MGAADAETDATRRCDPDFRLADHDSIGVLTSMSPPVND